MKWLIRIVRGVLARVAACNPAGGLTLVVVVRLRAALRLVDGSGREQ